MRHFKKKLRLERLEARETPAITAIGNEFPVNAPNAGNQNFADVASDADGDFVVVWQSSNGDFSGPGVFGQRYDAAGNALGGEFPINTFTTANQAGPTVAMDSLGNFVVAWTSVGQDGDSNGVYAQRFNAAGVRRGPEVRINQVTTGDQGDPGVAMSANGDYVICWQSTGQEPGGTNTPGVFARRYAADGTALGGEFQVNTFVTNVQSSSDVAIDADGDFVIVWQSSFQNSTTSDIYGQRYSSAGVALGGEFRVNSFTTGHQTAPSVGMDAAGNFTVAWQTPNQASATSGFDIFHRRFDAAAVPLGDDANVAVVTNGDQTAPDVTRSAAGQYVIGFETIVGSSQLLKGLAFDALGVPVTGELQFNTSTLQGSERPKLASDAEGDFVVAWSSANGAADDVFARRFDESVDAAAPWAVSLFAQGEPSPIVDGERLVAPVSGFVLTFSEAMATAGGGSVTAINNYILNRNGANINAQIASVGFAFNAGTRRHEATFTLSAPLDFGDFELGLGAAIDDATGNGIDGNFDGAPGGGFAVEWRIAAPTSVGPEFRVNSTTASTQSQSSVAVDAVGNYVVVWDSPDGSNEGIFARRFANDGTPLTGEIAVNTFTTGGQRFPDVGADAAGNFVVVWESQSGQDGNLQGIFGRRFSANGAPLGGEFQVNSFTTGVQADPEVAVNSHGEFVVAWASFNQDGANGGIYARRYAADGSTGSEFRANVVTTDNQDSPAVAIDAFGSYVIAWQSLAQDRSGAGIYFRRFDATGALVVADQRANATTTGDQSRPSVAAARGGDFVIGWDSNAQDGSGDGIYARRYSESGTALATEFRVNTSTTGDQTIPGIALDADGDFAIVWQSNPTGSNVESFVRRFSAGGDALSGDVQVNTTTTISQSRPAVAADGDGDLLVVWQGNGPGDSAGIFGQRFGTAAAPPQVASVRVNDGTAQRSRVTSLAVTFNGIVAFATTPVAAFTLTRNGGGPVSFTANVLTAGLTTTVTLTGFSGSETEFGSLRDGRYTLTALASQISAGGQQMAANFTFGDDQGLFRFYGDINGDRRIDISDFGFFSLAYLTSANFNPALDFNGDGRIDITDFGQFSLRYFTNLP